MEKFEQLFELTLDRKVIAKAIDQNTTADEVDEIFTQLTEEDFTEQPARELFRVMKSLRESGTAPTLVTIGDKISDRLDLYEELGTLINKTVLVSRTPARVLVDNLLEKSNHRKQEQYIDRLKEKWENGQDYSEELNQLTQNQFITNKFHIKSMSELADEIQTSFIDSYGQQLPTGFKKLDEQLTGGLRKGWFYIIGARSGHGKTALASSMFRNIVNAGKVAYYISLEMKAVDIGSRIFCGEAGLSERAIAKDGQRFAETYATIKKWENALFDDRSRTISDIEQNSRYAVKRMGADVIFVDYIGLVQGETKRSRVEEIAEYSRRLATLSKELDRPIVCLSQINRVSDNRTPVTVGGFDFKVPAMIDLADSSSLEKDADCILMLSVAEEMDTGRRPLLTNGQNPAVIRIEKNRKGEKGHIIKLSFNGGTTTFTESGW